MNLEKTIEQVEDEIRRLETLDPKDRLEMISGINRCLNALLGMIDGLSFWVRTPEFMSLFGNKETLRMFEKIRKNTIDLLKLGVEYSRLAISHSKRSVELDYLV